MNRRKAYFFRPAGDLHERTSQPLAKLSLLKFFLAVLYDKETFHTHKTEQTLKKKVQAIRSHTLGFSLYIA